MGLDGTIKRPDGNPLGDAAFVEQALAAAFPGVAFGWTPSGAEKIRAAARQGVTFPDIIRRHMESAPAERCGEFEGPACSAQFHLGSSETVREVGVVLYGDTTAAEPMLQLLEKQYGWATTYP